jgi:hypothetical protein
VWGNISVFVYVVIGHILKLNPLAFDNNAEDIIYNRIGNFTGIGHSADGFVQTQSNF